MQNPIFAALDLDSPNEALSLARKLRRLVGGFKLGPRLVIPYGGAFIAEIAKLAPVFLDCKFLDIPNTMESSVRAAFHAGASFATVHAWSGPVALSRLARLEQELNRERPFRILAVTILTSFDSSTLAPPLTNMDIPQQVCDLAKLCVDCGIHGLVTSGRELPILQQQFPQAFKVVPGIRMPEDKADDQQRTMTPKEALQNGASALVIGRPIVAAADPVSTTEKILATLQ